MNHQLIKDIQILNLSGDSTGTAAATETQGGIVDMQGFDGVVFICISATSGYEAATDMYASHAATTSATFRSVEVGGGVVASAAAATTSRHALVLDIYRPQKRYLKANHTSGTIGDVELVLAIQYAGSKPPVAMTTDTPLNDLTYNDDVTAVATPTSA